MKRNLLAILVTAMLPALAVAGDGANLSTSTPFESFGQGPTYFVDYSTFQGVGGQTYVEFYIQAGYNDLQFFKNGKKFQAGYQLELSVTSESGEVLEHQKTKDVFQVNTFAETVDKKKARVLLMAFSFDPGRYKLKTKLKDLETHKIARVEEYITARDYTGDELLVSDVQLSQKIAPAEEGQPYVKNQRYVEPNPVRTFVHGARDIYVYFEAYNLLNGCENHYTNYVADFTIKDEKGRQYAHLCRHHPKPGATTAHSIKLPVDQFVQGKYTLTVKVKCEDTGRETQSSTEFLVFDNPISMNTLEPADYYR